MFSRVEYSEWHTLFPKIGFALFFLAFAIIVWRVLRTPKSEMDRSSALPLEEDETNGNLEDRST